MSLPFFVRRSVVAAVACFAAAVLLSCSSGNNRSEPPPFENGSGAPLQVECILGTDSVLAGASPILVLARVTRGNFPVSGASVRFAPSRGLAQPPEVLTDAEGMATTEYVPPGTAGAARLDLTATDQRQGDSAQATCSLQVIAPRDPRLNVQMIVPPQAAGLSVRVLYDPARVDLPAGAARAAGPFASPGCLPIANDSGLGLVELAIVCGTLQTPSGNIATFDFVHLAGAELAPRDFTVSCTAFDEQGRDLAAACTTSVTQL